jgi:beta-galactosidase/beta-glucuronidase
MPHLRLLMSVDLGDRAGRITGHPPGYPRPLMVRRDWTCLDGTWEFSLDPEGRWQEPAQVPFSDRIEVPFAPETTRSGIGAPGFFRACWYRRQVEPPALHGGQRLLLRFGAVDYRAQVWVQGVLAAEHEGGYTPFLVDLTGHLGMGPLEVVVRAEDDPHDLAKPRGKQDWQAEPHSIWYPRTTGIWQTVWMEVVPAISVSALRFTPNLYRWELGIQALIAGQGSAPCSLQVRLTAGDRLLAADRYEVLAGEVSRRIAFSDPGIDDSRNELLWSPESPTLIEAEVSLLDAGGQLLDDVRSYTALRTIEARGDRILLNGRPYALRMVLDQGYWPDTGMTAPDDQALRRDVELARAMGFNGVRKHQKIEDPRYLYWADQLGLLVWEEMPSAYRFTAQSVERLAREWMAVLQRDHSHPCIIAWVPFNESWGVPNLPDNATERHWVQALYHLTRTFDASRLVVGNDGWESVVTDVIGIHDYDEDPARIGARYRSPEDRPKLFQHARPGGRDLVLGQGGHGQHPVILSEFGGMSCSPAGASWGYSRCRDAKELGQRYAALLATVRSLDLLAGFCYTQFADTFQEANGLLYADRTPKFPLEQIALATRGDRRAPSPPG